jgi:septation ring formation regulator EzrA
MSRLPSFEDITHLQQECRALPQLLSAVQVQVMRVETGLFDLNKQQLVLSEKMRKLRDIEPDLKKIGEIT